ncbi:MAG: methylated-DNA--[protein]-cysteine S-methyltransferase [Desulfovibrio sp.]|nr:methylated-DNA--[protein]-cysteine S-methyltransferase [Desulfovibrio sp.]
MTSWGFGQPKTCRAVGMAGNKNPIGIIIPCRRVIDSDGQLPGYAAGTERKKFLPDLENHIYCLSFHMDINFRRSCEKHNSQQK